MITLRLRSCLFHGSVLTAVVCPAGLYQGQLGLLFSYFVYRDYFCILHAKACGKAQLAHQLKSHQADYFFDSQVTLE